MLTSPSRESYRKLSPKRLVFLLTLLLLTSKNVCGKENIWQQNPPPQTSLENLERLELWEKQDSQGYLPPKIVSLSKEKQKASLYPNIQIGSTNSEEKDFEIQYPKGYPQMALDKKSLISIISDPDAVTPNYLVGLGQELFLVNNLAEGMFWYQLGRLRITQDIALSIRELEETDNPTSSTQENTLFKAQENIPPFLTDTTLKTYDTKLKDTVLQATRRAIQWDRMQPKKYDRHWGERENGLQKPNTPEEDASLDESLRKELLYQTMQIVEGKNVNLMQPEEIQELNPQN